MLKYLDSILSPYVNILPFHTEDFNTAFIRKVEQRNKSEVVILICDLYIF